MDLQLYNSAPPISPSKSKTGILSALDFVPHYLPTVDWWLFPRLAQRQHWSSKSNIFDASVILPLSPPSPLLSPMCMCCTCVCCVLTCAWVHMFGGTHACVYEGPEVTVGIFPQSSPLYLLRHSLWVNLEVSIASHLAWQPHVSASWVLGLWMATLLT